MADAGTDGQDAEVGRPPRDVPVAGCCQVVHHEHARVRPEPLAARLNGEGAAPDLPGKRRRGEGDSLRGDGPGICDGHGARSPGVEHVEGEEPERFDDLQVRDPTSPVARVTPHERLPPARQRSGLRVE